MSFAMDASDDFDMGAMAWGAPTSLPPSSIPTSASPSASLDVRPSTPAVDITDSEEAPSASSISDVLEKERLTKEIVGMQDGLRALLDRVDAVQGECTKLQSSNELLETYIGNLTRNNALVAGSR